MQKRIITNLDKKCSQLDNALGIGIGSAGLDSLLDDEEYLDGREDSRLLNKAISVEESSKLSAIVSGLEIGSDANSFAVPSDWACFEKLKRKTKYVEERLGRGAPRGRKPDDLHRKLLNLTYISKKDYETTANDRVEVEVS